MHKLRFLGRFLAGAGLFLRVLLSYRLLALRNVVASSAVRKERQQRLHARNALLLRENMIALRGVFIKIGQFLSSRVDILPEEYTSELSKLQDQVPPAPFADIVRRVTEELGPMEEVFSSFDEDPIAAASLGQVHKACLRDGECIVVKVQYPGIEDVIAADMRTLKFVIAVLRILYRQINLDVIYSEFSRIIVEELDYIQEGRNAEAFRRNFAKDERIKIPLVFWPYTTKKVLTLEYLAGVKITDFDEIEKAGIDKRETARVLAEAYAQMFFRDGLFHGDPHPGNIFVRPGPEIVLVDFGMVDRISQPKREGLRRAFTAIVDRDSRGLVRSLVDMGFIPLTRDIQPLIQFVDKLLQKYRDISPSEFKAMDIEEIGDDIMEALRINPAIQIPNDFILFGRVVGMLNGLGSRLDERSNIIEISAPFAKKFIKSDDEGLRGTLARALTAGRSLGALPGLLHEFLVTTARGETRVEITSADIVAELRKIHRVGKGFILTILFTGFGLAAAFLKINQFDALSAWTAGGAVFFLLWLVVVLRKG